LKVQYEPDAKQLLQQMLPNTTVKPPTIC